MEEKDIELTKLEELEALENELTEWLLDSDFSHPEYENKRQLLNYTRASIEIKTRRKPSEKVSGGLPEYSLPKNSLIILK